MANRMTLDIRLASDPWPLIDAWAARTRHSIASHGDWGRVYQRGDGFFQARSYVQITVSGDLLHLESWIIVWFTGGELDVSSRSLVQFFPRRRARRLLNDLLASLGQPSV